MARKNLTVEFIRSRKAAPPGKRIDHFDAVVPGLALRVTDRGHKSFVLVARYPSHPKNPTRRFLGDVYIPPKNQAGSGEEQSQKEGVVTGGVLSLAEARDKARHWLDLLSQGIDPAQEDRRRKVEIQRRVLFGALREEFLKRYRTKSGKPLKKLVEAARILRGDFKGWDNRPADQIDPQDVAASIRSIVDRGSPYQARNALQYVGCLYHWAAGNPEFGIKASPVAGLKPGTLVGGKEVRDRVLNDAELRAIWDAAGKMGYPYGPVFRLLMLTGQRELEIAHASWPEIDGDMLIIAASRMKGDRTHELPLTSEPKKIIESLPRFTGPHLFTTTWGEKPINGFSKAKQRIDALSGVEGWVIHDIRRTVRTRFSALPVQDVVREAVIAHARKGLHKVYDQHEYREEKRHCLELWEKRLSAIVEPQPDNVADLHRARTERAKAKA